MGGISHFYSVCCSSPKHSYRGSSMALHVLSLQWRHIGRHGVSNHQLHHCLLHRLFRWDQRKHQSSASLAFVWGIHRWPVNSPHKWPVTRKMFPFDDVIMFSFCSGLINLIYCLAFDWSGELIFVISFVPSVPSLVLKIGVESCENSFLSRTCCYDDMSVTLCFYPWCTSYTSVKWVINRLVNGFVPAQLNPSI